MDGWTKGPIVRVRCMNEQCDGYRKVRVVRPPRAGDVLLWGVWRCALCLHQMETKNRRLEPDGRQW